MGAQEVNLDTLQNRDIWLNWKGMLMVNDKVKAARKQAEIISHH